MSTQTTVAARRTPTLAASYAVRLTGLAHAYLLGKITFEEHRDASRNVWAEVDRAQLAPQVAAIVAKREES